MAALDTLVDLAGSALADGPVTVGFPAGPRGEELRRLLTVRNGFYAFVSALHVLPSGTTDGGPADLARWNSADLWRHTYGSATDGCTFFAEDAFGGQFCIRDEEIFTFDPETGDLEALALDLEGWAQALLDEHEVLTGHPLAQSWQEEYGPLPAGRRLVPKQPFVLGGPFEWDNLYDADAVEAMCFRGDMARQIADLPDGASLRIHFSD